MTPPIAIGLSVRLSLLLFLICPSGVFAQAPNANLVDSGASATFSTNAGATAYAWTLDGASVGTNRSAFSYSPDVSAVGTHDLVVTQTLPDGSKTTTEWGVRVRIPIATSPIQYYVSTTGSDANTGTIGAPFLTLEKARDTLRTVSHPAGATVFLRGGTYFRSSSFVLSGSDSGSSATAPVIYTSYPGETAILNGGKPLLSSQWIPLAASEQSRLTSGVSPSQIWEADCTALGLTHKGPFPTSFSEWTIYNPNRSGSGGLGELFYNGTRMWLSRYPNHNLTDDTQTPFLKMNGVATGADDAGTGYLSTVGNYTDSSNNVVRVGGAFHYNTADASHVSRWQTALAKGGAWVDGYWRVAWQINGAQILGIDTTNQVIEIAPGGTPSGGFGSKYSPPAGNKAEPYCVLNLLEEIDQPGEWAIDFSRNKIYFMMPTTGVAPADNSVIITDMSTPVIQITGSNIILKSLTLEDSLAQGVQVMGGSQNLVTGCTFRNIGSYPVEINNISGGTYNGVVSCDMSNLASGGVLVRGGNSTASPRVPCNNFVVNNNIQDFAQVVRIYAAAVDVGFQYGGPAVGARVAHNRVSGTPHAGILWKDYDHILEYNDVSNYCQFSNDLGGIYTYNPNYVSNTVIRYNYLHDSPHGEGVYFDSDHINATVFGNVANLHTLASEGRGYGFYDQTPGSTANGMPITDTRYNNIAVNCHYGLRIYSGKGGTIESNATYRNTGWGYSWNLITTSGTTQSTSGSSAAVLASGPNMDYTTDPGFMDFAHDDLRLRPDSRIYTDMPKFQEIPFEMIGLCNDEYRSNASGHSPFISTLAASPAAGASFTIHGNLTYPEFDGGTTVLAYWGTADAGTTAANWQNVVNLGTQSAGPVSTALSGLSTAGTYYYRFYATNAYGSAWAPTTVTVTPPPTLAPTGVTTLAGHSQVVLSWNPVTQATSYNIKRSITSGSGYVTIGSAIGTTYTDSTVTDGTTYYYVISATNSIAETPNSDEVVAAPLKLPAAWASQDIGSTAFIGSSSLDPYGKYTVAGSGADIWNTADACQFAGRPWQGDGVLVARILDFTNTSNYTKVGVMFRETLLANSRNVYAGADGQSKWVIQNRTGTGSSTAQLGSATSGTLPRWIKLVRSGNTFTAYQSGNTSPIWVALGSAASVTMAASGYAGLAVSAHDNTKLCTADFDNVIFLATPRSTTGLNQVVLTWLPSTGAVSYLVQRSTVSGSGYTTVVTLPAGTTTYTDTGLTNGNFYYYVITAIGDGGLGVSATSPQITVQPGVLNVPTALAGIPGYSQTALSWSASTGAVSYNIKRSTTSGSGYVTIASVTGTAYLDTSAANGTTYYYGVSAVSSWAAESANSTQLSVEVGPLQNTGFETPVLASGAYSYNTAGGSWTFAAQSGANGSGISTNTSTFTLNNTAGPPQQGNQVAILQGTGSISQVVNGLIPGATYSLTFAASERYTNTTTNQKQTFQVKLDNTVFQTFAPGATGAGNTALLTGKTYTDYSIPLTPTTATPTLSFVGTNTNGGDNTVFLDNVRFVLQSPAVPTGLTATSITGQPTTLDWIAVSGATSYNVKRSLSRDSGYSVIATAVSAATPTYADPFATGTTTYYYEVAAVNPAGESANSGTAAAPAITAPGPVIVQEATRAAGAVVSFTTSAKDLNGATLTTVDTPAAGSVFPLGDTPVETSATDAAGSSATTSFTVTVADTTPPDIVTPGDLPVEATSSLGAVVNYAPTATDLVNGPVTATCVPASGTLCAFGTTLVTVTATDSTGNNSISTFNVTVVDTTPPVISTPGDLFVDATSSNGAVVTFTTSAVDMVSGPATTTPSVASGSTFPIGTTSVSVAATDATGNAGTAAFKVTVLPLPCQKANNSNALNLTTSWTGGNVPGNSDIALWSGTYAASSAAATIGTGLTAERLRFDATVSTAITIGTATGSLNLMGLSGTGLDMSAAVQNVTIASPVLLGSGSSQSWNVASGRTLTVSGTIGESVVGSGITASGLGTVVLSGLNTFTGGLTIAPPAGGLPVYKFGGNNPSAYVKLNGGSIGPITANGRLDLLSATTLGPISGSGAIGFICNSSTANNVLTFQGGSSFSMFYFGVDANKATLQQTGSGGVTFAFFGYSPTNNTPNANITFNGGTWSLGQTGQNNSNSEMTGTATLTNGAAVTQISQSSFTHGNWVINNGNLTVLGGTAQHIDGKVANLSFTLGSNGTLNIPAGGLTLGNNSASLLSLNDYLTLGNGGTANIGTAIVPGNLQLGSTNAQTAETDTVTLSGGKLVVSASILASTGTGQTRVFNWTRGQLSAFTITPSSNFAATSGTAGGITQTGLNQTGGTLAPGDVGTAGETVINGNYTSGTAATLAMDIGGTTQASGAFQNGQYDHVSVTGATLLGGNLALALINPGSFTPTNSQTFNMLNSTLTLTGSFANVAFGNRVVTTGSEGSFTVTKTGNTVVLGSYLALLPPAALAATGGNSQVALSWLAPSNTPSGTTYTVSRSTISGGPYSTASSGLAVTTYTDNNSGSGLTAGTTYFYTVTANYGGIATPASVEASAATYSDLQNWRQTYFGTIQNIGTAADTYDADADSVPNLLEYALGTNPTAATSRTLPVLGLSGNLITLTFDRVRSDVTYIVEGSNNLATWTPIATNPGNVGSNVTVPDNATGNPSQRFLRLRITNP